jgi:hypothetical protein
MELDKWYTLKIDELAIGACRSYDVQESSKLGFWLGDLELKA